MKLNACLSFLAAAFGLVGTILIARGVLFLNIESIANLSGLGDIWLYSLDKIDSWASQKADCMIGVYFIASAFLIQASVILFEFESTYISRTKTQAIAGLLVVIVIFIFISNVVSHKWQQHIKTETGIYLLKTHCQEAYSKEIDVQGYESIEKMSNDLLGMQRASSESRLDYLNRLAVRIHWSLEDVDCSGLAESDH